MTTAELGAVAIRPDTPPAEALAAVHAYRVALAREPMGLDEYVAELAARDLERRAPSTARTVNAELARVAKDGRGRRGQTTMADRIQRGIGRETREEQIDRTVARSVARIAERTRGAHG